MLLLFALEHLKTENVSVLFIEHPHVWLHSNDSGLNCLNVKKGKLKKLVGIKFDALI